MALQPYLLNEMLNIAEQQPLSAHTPGHKNGLFLPDRLKKLWGEQFAAYDFTELPGLDNLHFSEGCLAQSQQQVADFFGAAQSYYLVNGTTAGLQAAIMAACYQQEVFVPRHVHRSIYHSLIWHKPNRFICPSLLMKKQVCLWDWTLLFSRSTSNVILNVNA